MSKNITDRAAIESACQFIEQHIVPRKCDSDGVSVCWRCNSIYLAKRMRDFLAPTTHEKIKAKPALIVKAIEDCLFHLEADMGKFHPVCIQARAAIEQSKAAPPQPVAAEAVTGWIESEVMRPEPEVFVLCWDGRKTFIDWFGSKHPREFGITHWIPYPTPPGCRHNMHDGRRAFAAISTQESGK